MICCTSRNSESKTYLYGDARMVSQRIVLSFGKSSYRPLVVSSDMQSIQERSTCP
jgi:hypothetical protein